MMDQWVEELHERFLSWENTWIEDRAHHAALTTHFDTFEACYYAAEEERCIYEQTEREPCRSCKAEQHTKWAQRRSFEET